MCKQKKQKFLRLTDETADEEANELRDEERRHQNRQLPAAEVLENRSAHCCVGFES
jgi:hypothetical protein